MLSAWSPPYLVECEGNQVRDEDGSLQMIVLLCRDLIDSGEPGIAGLRRAPAAGSAAPNGSSS